VSINGSFQPQGNTFSVVTNATGSTASAQLVSFNPNVASQPAAQASGLQSCPSQAKIYNAGTVVVFISFTSALRTAAIPGTNPSLEFPVLPGAIVTVTIPQTPNVNSATPYCLQINTISATATQQLYVTFGEGR
jgi:hypothetical protein